MVGLPTLRVYIVVVNWEMSLLHSSKRRCSSSFLVTEFFAEFTFPPLPPASLRLSDGKINNEVLGPTANPNANSRLQGIPRALDVAGVLGIMMEYRRK